MRSAGQGLPVRATAGGGASASLSCAVHGDTPPCYFSLLFVMGLERDIMRVSYARTGKK